MEQLWNQIEIPFRRMFEQPMLSDIKTATSRTKKMGNVGDRFWAFGAWFELTEVRKESLSFIATLWKEEGCRSAEHFIEVWKTIHPDKGFDRAQIVWLHRFRRIQEAEHDTKKTRYV